MQKITVQDLGIIKYADALDVQTKKFNQLIDNKINERSNSDAHFLFLCEHEPVITLGKAANEKNILFAEDFLKEKGIDIFHINRGGDVTLHSIGQITGYPILDLEFFSSDIKKYMRDLEEVMIQTIAEYGIIGYRIENETGVWIDNKTNGTTNKIAAFGVKTSRWITMHGFALNVDINLNQYNYINPCGFTEKGVTSISNELNIDVDINEVKRILLDKFAAVFNVQLINNIIENKENIDKRNQLILNPFTYKVTKENKILIYRNSKLIKVISDKSNTDFLKLIAAKKDEQTIQLALAKLTGNYKHGNE